jgi:hypothetical protein
MDTLEQLLIDFKESLKREIGEIRQEIKSGFAQMEIRFDSQAARLERHAALIQTGNRRTSAYE